MVSGWRQCYLVTLHSSDTNPHITLIRGRALHDDRLPKLLKQASHVRFGIRRRRRRSAPRSTVATGTFLTPVGTVSPSPGYCVEWLGQCQECSDDFTGDIGPCTGRPLATASTAVPSTAVAVRSSFRSPSFASALRLHSQARF